MTLRSLKIACLVTGIIAPIVFSPWSMADNGIENISPPSQQLSTQHLSLSLRLPKDNKVIYKGVANFDATGAEKGSMMYPGVDAFSFLAAVFAHGVIVESSKKSKRSKLQEDANKVLTPYQEVLSNYTHKELMQKGLEKMKSAGNKKLVELSESPGASSLIESMPVFSITQDQSTFVLDNAISIYTPDTPSTAIFQSVIRVVSQAKIGMDLPDFWTANQGEMLKEESASLFAESLDIALAEVSSGPNMDNNIYKTIRYFEGTTEKMERGQVISENCSRVVIKTLRGSLMSVPAKQSVTCSY